MRSNQAMLCKSAPSRSRSPSLAPSASRRRWYRFGSQPISGVEPKRLIIWRCTPNFVSINVTTWKIVKDYSVQQIRKKETIYEMPIWSRRSAQTGTEGANMKVAKCRLHRLLTDSSVCKITRTGRNKFIHACKWACTCSCTCLRDADYFTSKINKVRKQFILEEEEPPVVIRFSFDEGPSSFVL